MKQFCLETIRCPFLLFFEYYYFLLVPKFGVKFIAEYVVVFKCKMNFRSKMIKSSLICVVFCSRYIAVKKDTNTNAVI